MPTILNNSCINRVAKVKKFLFTSNDLTALKANPYTLLTLKDVSISRLPIYFMMFCDSDADYTGSLFIAYSGSSLQVDQSYNTSESLFFLQKEDLDTPNVLSIRADESFNVGDIRGPVEFHVYYYEESVSVPFDFELLDNS